MATYAKVSVTKAVEFLVLYCVYHIKVGFPLKKMLYFTLNSLRRGTVPQNIQSMDRKKSLKQQRSPSN